MEYSKKRVINKAIPDNDPNGLNDTIQFQRDLTVKSVALSVNVKHPYNGDVSIQLSGPNGKFVNILKPGRGPGKNIKKTFSGEIMKSFEGIKSKGKWNIKVVDGAPKDNGSLEDWTLDWVLANPKKSEIFIEDKHDLASIQYCHQFGSIEAMTAEVNIEHGHVGDLVLVLTAPSGKSVTLHNRSGGNEKSINKTFDAVILKDFKGETAKGKWSMKISDTMPRDAGRLISWGLKIKTKQLDSSAMKATTP